MCGILGIFSFNNKEIEKSTLTNSLATLAHRGPDYHNLWISADKKAALGHSRLAIIDLVTGNQPLTNEARNVHLVVNGEFYGFEKQRAELVASGHTFSTSTDSEIALHLYETYGTDFLSKLRGEFSFIIWDERNQLCFAARDRFGIKPLFYSFYNNTLYLASEVKALLAAGVPARWDKESMSIFLNSTLNLVDRTPFENIRQVPPGCFLLAKDGNSQVHKYWDLDYPVTNKEMPLLSKEDYVSELQMKLEDAVRVRLRADVPVGCYLSGGLDSSVILGLAARQSKKAMPAFTLTFDNEDYDEHDIAKDMAAKTGAIFHPIHIKQNDLATNFADAVWHAETFFFNGHGIAKFLLSEKVRDAGYKVVLTGEGADELFGGYVHFRIDQLFHGKSELDQQSKLKLLEELKHANNVSMGMLFPSGMTRSIANVDNILGFTPSWLLVGHQGASLMDEVLTDEYKNHLATDNAFERVLKSLDIDDQLTHREPFNQSLYLWSKIRLPNYILSVLGDRMEMAHSIEGRLPFLDHHVAEFLRNVPVKYKVHGITEKYLLREAGKPVLTKTVYDRQKHPFLAPPAALNIKGAFHELLQHTLRGNTLSKMPFYDRHKVIALLDRLPKMTKSECIVWDPVLMIILSSCIMQQRFNLSM